MKVLIFGGSGMLGHKLCQAFAADSGFDTHATFRQTPASALAGNVFGGVSRVEAVSIDDFAVVRRVIEQLRPAVVVNCVGVVKQLAVAKDSVASISANALFPHQIAQVCGDIDARLIHISTDCVFSGNRGGYAEEDVPDAADLYGRSKLLGEVTGDGCMTIRTSIIGRELHGAHGLVEWFLGQRGKHVRGFRRALFSGWTTLELARIIRRIVTEHAHLSGLWHVAAAPIDKYELLSLVRDACRVDVEIEEDTEFVCDRTLDGSRFECETGICAPEWSRMIAEMCADETPYEDIRRKYAEGFNR